MTVERPPLKLNIHRFRYRTKQWPIASPRGQSDREVRFGADQEETRHVRLWPVA